MTTVILNVPDITCGHCERTITGALAPIEGVHSVAVDISAKQVQVEYDPSRVDLEHVKATLAEEDYPVATTSPHSA
jgi:copper chaperone CopZ